ncbi:uncharacterized protein LDX57_002985 [Aspergillus melleus]|uniref:uncharacterized protein n=1 Tax=Aspergillus melleus TaxID=138277 RepID=UPI001E8D300C|nr:uncharacterized protein LDX57_002985 [Aspergillus melleus]KAH8425227.1 hypothetical protein LDX57_002985 [Aspergillus melleus]
MSAGSGIKIPFEVAINPDLDRARAQHFQWIENAGLIPDTEARKVYEATDFPRLVAYTYPSACAPQLDLITNLIGWSFILDDSLDKPGILKASPKNTADALSSYREVLYGRTSETPGVPLVTAWREFLRCVHERSSEALKVRHRTHWENLFDGFQQEAENNASGSVPEFTEYLELRRAAGGVEICLDWAEAIGDFEVPSSVHKDPNFLQLREDADDVVSMTNDIFSVRKEYKGGNTDNVVFVLAKQKQCTWEQAIEIAQGLITETVAHFQSTEAEFLRSACFISLTPQDRLDTFKFLDAMKHWMRGSLEWHLNSPRYK